MAKTSVPTHNRQWTADNSGSDSTPLSESQSDSSGYSTRPGRSGKQDRDTCLDVTSHRFTPEDEFRVSLVLRKMIGDDNHSGSNNNNIFGSDGEKLIVHNYPRIRSQDVTGIPAEEAPGADLLSPADDNRYATITDFATVEQQEPTIYQTITKRDSITFLLLHRPITARGKCRWEIPTAGLSQDFLNYLLSRLYAEDIEGAVAAYTRIIPTIVLESTSLSSLSEFPRLIVLTPYKVTFNTFPRDAIIAKPDVSILLCASMKTFHTEIIPKVLFSRNAGIIAGALRVVATRFFGADETSHKGESKEHWRSIDLKGDEQFM